MNATLYALASRKLDVARENALRARQELEETFSLLLRIEDGYSVRLDWPWRDSQKDCPAKHDIDGADYLRALQLEQTCVQTSAELLDKAVTSATNSLRIYEDTWFKARLAIRNATELHETTVKNAEKVLASTAGENITLPEKNIPPAFEGFGCLLGPVCGFFVGGFVAGLLRGILNVQSEGGFVLTLFGSMALFYFLPQLCAYGLWKAKCRETISVAKAKAERDLAVAHRKFASKPPVLQQAHREAEELAARGRNALIAIQSRQSQQAVA
jgi:hypothetical protein